MITKRIGAKNRYFCQEDISVSNRHMKRCSTPLIIWEMHIKTIMKYQLISVRIAITQNITSNKCQPRCGGKGILMYHWWNCKLLEPPWKTLCRFLRKNKSRTTVGPTNSISGYYYKKKKTII